MRKLNLISGLFGGVTVLAIAATALGQGAIPGGTSSTMNLGSMGGSGSSGMGSSGMGSSGSRTTGSSSGGGTFGNRSMGQGVSAGQRTMGRGTTTPDTAGQLNSSASYLRQNRKAGSFVGADSRDQTNTSYLLGSQAGAAGNTAGRGGMSQGIGMSGMNRLNSRGMQGMQGMRGMQGMYGGMNQQQQRQVRTSLTVDFDHPQINGVQVVEGLSKRLTENRGLRTLTPVQVVLGSDGSAMLTGTVATERDRVLAERLALLEPGIWRIQNDLTVSGQATPVASPAESTDSPALGIAAPRSSLPADSRPLPAKVAPPAPPTPFVPEPSALPESVAP